MLFNRRYLQIIRYFGGLALEVIFWEIFLRKIGLGFLSNRNTKRRYAAAARRFRALAIRMGGVMIKVGQFLSSRIDVLPEYITDELSALQDEVPPEDYRLIKKSIEDEFALPVSRLFASFQDEPVAAASLGQVHRAVTFSGEQVMVKVRRPGIIRLVQIDMAALKTVMGWLKYWDFVSSKVDVVSLYDEFSKILWEELDYEAEAGNAKKFAEIFADDDTIRIPRLYDEFSSKSVLTLEDVLFIKITDYDDITAAGVDRHEVAERLLNVYLHQIFNEYFFHADPHPGNLFVEPPGDDHGWRLVFVDFGMVGRISPDIRDAGKEAVVGVITRDAERLLKAASILHILLPGTNTDVLKEAITRVFDRFWGLSMDELKELDTREMMIFLDDLRNLLYEMPFQIPENLIYLGRCIAILSGMCTGLDPSFNVFSSLVPFGKELIKEDAAEGGWEFIKQEFIDQAGRLVNMPKRVDQLMTRAENGNLAITTRPSADQARQFNRLTAAINRFSLTLVFTSFFVSGTLMYINHDEKLAYAGWGAALFFLVVSFLKK